jgi:DNA-binding transcriptional MocR family regulator
MLPRLDRALHRVEGQNVSQSWPIEDVIVSIGPWTHRQGRLNARLADALADAIAQTGVDAGDRLPPERHLAEALDVSRGTVVAAYGALAERGIVERRRGSGTTITAPRRASAGRHHRDPRLNRIIAGPDVAIDVSFGGPHYDDLVADLGATLPDAVRAGAPAHGYAALGLPALREGIADLLTGRGVPSRPDEILVTAGAQGAIQLLTTALVRRGDRVIVEAPTYPGAIELFSRAGAVVLGVRRDEAGPRPDELDRLLSTQPAALVFLVPTCHNPTGDIVPESRRRELLEVCDRHDVLVVEDGTLSELVFDGHPPRTLAELAGPDRVIAVGSFSKVMWGGLRTGWVRADAATILRLARLKAVQDLGSGILDQVACLNALPRFEALVAQRRVMAKARHEHLRAAIGEQLPSWETHAARGGYSLWCRLPHGSGEAFANVALGFGVAIGTGGASAPEELFLDHVRICHALEPELLDLAVGRLAAAWERHDAAARRPLAL